MARTLIYAVVTAVTLGAIRGHAQETRALLEEQFLVRAADRGTAGEFIVLGLRHEQEIRFWIGNGGSDGTIVLGPDFIQGIQVDVHLGAREIPVRLEWEPDVMIRTRTGEEHLSAAGLDVRLQPRDGAVFKGVLRLNDRERFGPGDYTLTLSDTEAKKRVRNEQGLPWAGRYNAQATYRMVIKEPSTPDEIRQQKMTDADALLEKGQLSAALKLGLEVLAVHPTDRDANLGVGRIYSTLGDYKRAVVHLERGASQLRLADAPQVARSLALAYLAVGNESMAEAVLVQSGMTIAAARQEVTKQRETLQGLRPAEKPR